MRSSWHEAAKQALPALCSMRNLFHLHREKNIQHSYGEYDTSRIPVISRVLLQTSMCLVAIYRISATFYHPPGRADQLSVFKRSTQSKMRAETVMRTSHLEKCFWDSSHEKLSLISSCWMTQHCCQSTSLQHLLSAYCFFWQWVGKYLSCSCSSPKQQLPVSIPQCRERMLCAQKCHFLLDGISHRISSGSIFS